MKIKGIISPDEKKKIAESVLSDLPEWFGMPEYTNDYILKSMEMPFIAVFIDEEPIGFVSLKETGEKTAEIFVMGVKKKFHHSGAGTILYRLFEEYAGNKGYLYIQVKTVQSGHYDEYDRTNLFYKKMGFSELECFPEMWDAWNPCQIYIKYIGQ